MAATLRHTVRWRSRREHRTNLTGRWSGDNRAKDNRAKDNKAEGNKAEGKGNKAEGKGNKAEGKG
jgi:hypothetical protein